MATAAKKPITKKRAGAATAKKTADPVEVKVPAAIKQKAERLLELKRDRDEAVAEIEKIQNEILDFLEDSDVKTIKLPFGSFTRVQTEPLVIDDEKLKKAVGAAMWNKITTKKLDRKKLDAFVKSGEIATKVLASVSEIVPGKPFIRSSAK